MTKKCKYIPNVFIYFIMDYGNYYCFNLYEFKTIQNYGISMK